MVLRSARARRPPAERVRFGIGVGDHEEMSGRVVVEFMVLALLR